MAKTTPLDIGDFGGLRIQLVVHAVGGLLLLSAATVLSVYKPWGMTPYGRRKQQENAVAIMPTDRGSSAGTRRGHFLLIGIIGVVLLFLILHHVFGGGLSHH